MNLDNSTNVFFELVKAGLWEKEVRLSPNKEIVFPEVYRIAEEQCVVGLVAAGLEHVADVKVPQQWALRFAGQAIQLEQRNKAMNIFIAKLISILRDRNIYALLLKGQGIAECYERPQWRASGDVDLFLSDDNYKAAKSVLLPMASSVEEEGKAAKHQGMIIDGFDVELHGTLNCGFSFRVDSCLRDIMNAIFYEVKVRSWQNGRIQVFLPSADEDVVYVFTHFLGHFYKGGIGLRQICDWCRLLYTYRDSLNYELLEQRIKRAGLVSEWNAFGALAIEYLGFPKDSMPLLDVDLNAKLKKKADKICKFILEVGNFGHNRDNSYFQKHSYFVQKCISAWRRVKDLCRHATIFPVSSMRFFFGIMHNGIVSAVRGEK